MSNMARYNQLLKLSQLITEHKKVMGKPRERCKGCEICDTIEYLESKIGTVADNKTSLTDDVREKIKKRIRKGDSDATIVTKLGVSYNTVKTYRQIVKREDKK